MSGLIVRLVLAMLLVPIAAMVYFIAFLGFEYSIGDFYAFVWAGVFTGVFVGASWLSIWRGVVRWTPWRRWATGLMGFVSVAAAGCLGLLATMVLNGPDETFVAFVASTLGILFWLASTVIFWRETPAERADRIAREAGRLIVCPKCGYNLMGLYEAMCPECGTRFTLDQLYGAQRAQSLGSRE